MADESRMYMGYMSPYKWGQQRQGPRLLHRGVGFRFAGQSSMTFYTAINPSAEFEFTSGDEVVTTAMLRND
jgi:hypothetical protein